MPDVIDRITHDHREVEQMFAEFAQTNDRDLALRICDELTAHTIAEDKAVYPKFEEELNKGDDLVPEAEDEHKEARRLIGRIRQTTDDDHLSELMTELRKAIEHHVEEEETEMLPMARKEIDGEQLSEIGDAFENEKQKVELAG